MKKGIILAVILILSIIIPNKIKAAEIVIPVEPTNYSLYYNSGGFDCVDNQCDWLYKNMYMLYSGNVMNSYTLTLYDFTTNAFDYVEFPFAIGTPEASLNTNQIVNCSQWSESNGRYTCTSSNNQAQEYGIENIVNNLSFQIEVDYSDLSGVKSICSIQSNQIICPTLRHNVSHLYFKVFARTNGVNTGTEVFKFFIGRRVKPYVSNSTASAINSQTQTIMDTNTTYDTNSTAYTNETTTINDMEQAQEQLMDSLDFSVMDDLNITVNPNASTFIWDIANRLRSMNGAIVLLITSMLSMGIIKMVLNR